MANRAERRLSERMQRRIESGASKLLPKRVFNKPLPEQVQVARKMMGMSGMPNFRANLLKDEGLPTDIREKAKAGGSSEIIKAYYWGCPEFRQLWLDMEMTEATLDELIRGSLEEYAKKGR